MRPRRLALALMLGLAGIVLWSLCLQGTNAPTPVARDFRSSAEIEFGKPAAAPASAFAKDPDRPYTDESRVPAPTGASVDIHGVVSRQGIPVGDRQVVCVDTRTRTRRVTTTAADGSFRFAANAGEFEVELPMPAGTTHQQDSYRHWPALGPGLLRAGWHTVEIVDRDVRCDFELPGGTIVARAFDALSWQPIPHANLVWRPPPPIMEELHLRGDASGSARFLDVVDGKHEVIAQARGYRDAADHVEVAAQSAAIDLQLEPTGALDVVLVDERGQALELSAAQRVLLLHVDTSNVFDEPSNRAAFRRKPRPRVFEFDDLLPGQYWVNVPRDNINESAPTQVRFQPVEAAGPGEVDLIAGTVQRIEIPARHRCYAELTGVDRAGNRAKADLHLQWLDYPMGVAEVLPATWFSAWTSEGAHFEGYLAPGTYAVIFTHGGQIYRDRLEVDRANLRLSIPLPW